MRTISVLDIIEKTADLHENKVAVIDGTQNYTYGQLLQNAREFGYALHKELQGIRNKPVMIFMDKSAKCLAAMLGTLYSGNFYVPMDIKTPINRLESIFSTLEDSYIVTDSGEVDALRKIGYVGEVLIYEDIIAKWNDSYNYADIESIKNELIDTDLMYVLFTSGSTGTPKGVAVMHRSVVDYISAFTSEVNITSDDILGNQTPFYADMSLKDIYMTMKVGATLCIIPQKYFMSPKKLLQFLDDNKVTFLMWVPTAYRLISQFDALSKVKPENLNKFTFSGEVMPISVYQYWREYYPNAEFTQLYGPTEITGACTSYKVTREYDDNEIIPIGKPFSNTGIILLDKNDNEIKKTDVDKTGEICVYGSCLAAGYYNNTEKTDEVFVQNPLKRGYSSKMYRTGDLAKYNSDGELIFISRKDYQVKHGGRRVELGEIEKAFQSVEGLKAVCCVQNRREDKLVLYYIGDTLENEISLTVRDRLPKYMIPAEYHKMDELPLLPNGKLDRKQMDRWENE